MERGCRRIASLGFPPFRPALAISIARSMSACCGPPCEIEHDFANCRSFSSRSAGHGHAFSAHQLPCVSTRRLRRCRRQGFEQHVRCADDASRPASTTRTRRLLDSRAAQFREARARRCAALSHPPRWDSREPRPGALHFAIGSPKLHGDRPNEPRFGEIHSRSLR